MFFGTHFVERERETTHGGPNVCMNYTAAQHSGTLPEIQRILVGPEHFSRLFEDKDFLIWLQIPWYGSRREYFAPQKRHVRALSGERERVRKMAGITQGRDH